MLILLLLAIAVSLLFYIAYRCWRGQDSRNAFLKRQKRLRRNLEESFRNVEMPDNGEGTATEEIQVSSYPSAYVIEEDGTILRQDNDCDKVVQNHSDHTLFNPHRTDIEPVTTNQGKFVISSGHQSGEKAPQEEFSLRNKFLAGEQIDFSQCNSILDTVNDVELWKAIVKSYLGQPNKPTVNLINNYSSERAIEFATMIYRIVSSCVTTNNDWVQLPYGFLKNIIVFSKNIDALYCIADMQESDLLAPEYDNSLFDEIKQLAYNRYTYLTTKMM